MVVELFVFKKCQQGHYSESHKFAKQNFISFFFKIEKTYLSFAK